MQQRFFTASRFTWPRAMLSMAACCLVAAPVLNGAPASGDDDSVQTREFPGHTAPSEKRDQNFDVPGVVDKMLVKEGDTVKAGQLLAQQDLAADEAKLEQLKIKAKSTLEEQAEEAQIAKDIVDRDRKESLLKQKAIDPASVEESRLAVTVDKLKLAHAGEDRQTAAFEVAEQMARIAEKKLLARIDGIVSQISTHEGELSNSDTQHPTLTIVKNDPLYVEVDLPVELVKHLKPGQSLEVRYVDERATSNWRVASIHFIKPEADPGSNFEHVQLQMQNREMRGSGLQVTVRLPDNVAVLAPAQPAAAAADATH